MVVKARCLDVCTSLHFHNTLISMIYLGLLSSRFNAVEPLGRGRRPNQEKSIRYTSQCQGAGTKYQRITLLVRI